MMSESEDSNIDVPSEFGCAQTYDNRESPEDVNEDVNAANDGNISEVDNVENDGDVCRAAKALNAEPESLDIAKKVLVAKLVSIVEDPRREPELAAKVTEVGLRSMSDFKFISIEKSFQGTLNDRQIGELQDYLNTGM